MKRIMYILCLLTTVGIVNTNLLGGNDPFEEIVNKEKVSKKELAFQNLLMGNFIGIGAKITLQVENKGGDNRYMGYLKLNGERMNFSGTVKDSVLEGEISLSDGKKRPFTLKPGGKNLLFKTGTFTDELETMLKENFSITLADGVRMDMIWIAPGMFMMGSPSSELGRFDNETQHEVILKKGYWLGKYEVTQEQYKTIMGNNPSKFAGNNLPVEQVSWDDAMEFCKKLTEVEKEAGRLPEGCVYTLPTEAQWEYACRAGTTRAFNNEKNIPTEDQMMIESCPNLDEVGWYGLNSGAIDSSLKRTKQGKTFSVGRKKPNALGLYDMHGNVYEWCLDWPGDYPASSVTDPKGASIGEYRVCRGGSWNDLARDCRSASRSYTTPGDRYDLIGFRVCLSYSSNP